jgi:predicted phosphodiesterase
LKLDTVVIAGDIVDHQAVSFHAANPHCPGPVDEYLLTKQKIKKWYKAFPSAIVTIGNHDARVIRLAESVNIPSKFLRDYNEVWKTPKWQWVEDVIIDDVYYMHGTNRSGMHPAFNAMKDMLMSVVMGHCHSAAGVKWRANPNRRTFGMDTGCGIDVDAYQFAYGKHMRSRPILAAGAIIDGVPQHFIMPCGRGEKYHKSRFTKDPTSSSHTTTPSTHLRRCRG